MAAATLEEPDLQHAALLAAAAPEFVAHGLRGAKLETIARQAGVTRAMIYYYFGSREGLYVATLEAAYRHIRRAELALDLAGLDPVAALARLVAFRIDYYAENPAMVGLVGIENQHGAVFLQRSAPVRESGTAALSRTSAVLAAGQAAGLFRPEVDALDLHRLMVSLGFFNVSNRHTFGRIFGQDLAAPEQLARTRALAVDVVLRFVSGAAGHGPSAAPAMAPSGDVTGGPSAQTAKPVPSPGEPR